MRRWLRRALLAGIAALAAAAAWQVLTWPDVGSLAMENPSTTAFIERFRQREKEAGREGEVQWRWIPLDRISRQLVLAVLVAEDDTFFDHEGFATAQIRDALEEAWEERKPPRGASTLTQQVAKNLWLSPSRNPWRKVKEAILTVQLERSLEKRRILEIHLNVAEFGKGIYGAEAAARRYFGKPASELDASEAAQLAASLPRPSRWHPGSTSRAWMKRTRIIRERMARSGWLLSKLE